MKALSIKQPWASLIAHGIKDIENRNWRTNFRGKIYIHASANRIKTEHLGNYFSHEMFLELQKAISNTNLIVAGWVHIQPISAIIGEVEIIDCVINHSSIWAEQTPMNHYPIPKNKKIYNWVLANPVLYKEPIINVKGKLSFWKPDFLICSNCKSTNIVCWEPNHNECRDCKTFVSTN